MKIHKKFTVARPLSEVWDFFNDVAAVADCLPGAEYDGQDAEGRHTGRMGVKVGPVQTSFEGAAQVGYDATAHRITAEGKGVDKRGGSRGKMKLDCHLAETRGATQVDVTADIQLSGAIAQFGRTGIVEEIANVLIEDFVRNAEARLNPSPAGEAPDPATQQPVPTAPVSGLSLVWRALGNWFRGLVRSGASR